MRPIQMNYPKACLLLFAAIAALPCFAQTVPPDQDTDRNVSWKILVPNLASDQKAIWLSPVKLKERKYWLPTALVLGVTAGLIALDPVEGRYFHNSTSFGGFNNVFSSSATAWGTVVAPVSLYAIGFVGKDSKMKKTALLAGEAAADSEIVTTVLKSAGGRLRPSDVPLKGNYSDTWFENAPGTLHSNASFPSGHSIAAFSIATVIARRYRNHRWVPYVAYGGAALVGFSRLSGSAHFTSDVFVGGVLGYSISRFAVLQQ
jgi:membrane-associated phospholipid phosphatase